MTADLDALVRRVDEDRWLASRFAPADARRGLIAVYALNYEIARTAEIVSEGAIGDIRLAWWREALAEVAAGQPPRSHPVLEAFAAAHVETPFSSPVIAAMIEARGKDLDSAPFRAWEDIEAYIDATAGSVMQLALTACAASADAGFVRSAARTWGYTGLLRAEPVWRARGRVLLPGGVDGAAMTERARDAVTGARANRVPTSAFPALGYTALAPTYLDALQRGRNEVPLLWRQLKLVRAAATGRI